MSTVAIIPARYDSTRFPGKPLADIFGLPMISWVYDRAKAANLVDEVWVATDDQRILEAVQQNGGRAVMTPKFCETGTERCFEALKAIHQSFDIVVNVQGDEPLISPDDIDALITSLQTSDADIASLYRQFGEEEDPTNPNTVKVVTSHTSKALYFSRSLIPFTRDTEVNKKDYLAHVGLYAYTGEALDKVQNLQSSFLENCEKLEQLRWLEADLKIQMSKTQHKSLGIDTAEDLELLKVTLKANPELAKY